MKKTVLIFLASMFVFLPSSIYKVSGSSKALFVTVLQDPQVLSSQHEISKLIDFATASGIDTLFVQIYRANQSWFPSHFADDQPYKESLGMIGEDPFALLIKKAHSEGLQVHAWMNMLSL